MAAQSKDARTLSGRCVETRHQTYGSLTASACEIAGTRRSGPAFFGLRDGAPPPRTPAATWSGRA
ncbi:DUF2924 domain-containing protein [Ralstonia solanacearum species complex bacterium KE056]|uniref:DUF2924 domain-containing protein n=1 Tax=Ralstonia solanacearum species complex bacterium KE056 TaxID=3119585 RepID=UPI002FC36E32